MLSESNVDRSPGHFTDFKTAKKKKVERRGLIILLILSHGGPGEALGEQPPPGEAWLPAENMLGEEGRRRPGGKLACRTPAGPRAGAAPVGRGAGGAAQAGAHREGAFRNTRKGGDSRCQ